MSGWIHSLTTLPSRVFMCLIHHLLIEKLAAAKFVRSKLKCINQCIIMQIKFMKLSVKSPLHLTCSYKLDLNILFFCVHWARSWGSVFNHNILIAIKSRLFVLGTHKIHLSIEFSTLNRQGKVFFVFLFINSTYH